MQKKLTIILLKYKLKIFDNDNKEKQLDEVLVNETKACSTSLRLL